MAVRTDVDYSYGYNTKTTTNKPSQTRHQATGVTVAIHDIDKTNDQRSMPMPNTHDVQSGVRSAHGTNSVNFALAGSTLPSSNKNVGTPLGGIIATDTVVVNNDGSPVSTTMFPHNLGYVPNMIATMNNTINSGVEELVTVFLPAFLQANINLGQPDVEFTVYLYGMASSKNLYFQILNSTGSPVTAVVTYYLYRQPVG